MSNITLPVLYYPSTFNTEHSSSLIFIFMGCLLLFGMGMSLILLLDKENLGTLLALAGIGIFCMAMSLTSHPGHNKRVVSEDSITGDVANSKMFYLSSSLSQLDANHNEGENGTYQSVNFSDAFSNANNAFDGYKVCTSNDYPCTHKESLAQYKQDVLTKFNEAVAQKYKLQAMSSNVSIMPSGTSDILKFLDAHGITYKMKDGSLADCVITTKDSNTSQGQIMSLDNVYCSLNNKAQVMSSSQ